MNRAPAVGIDLGTCYSCIGVLQEGKVDIIPVDLGEKIIPSIVSFTNTQRYTGKEAKDKIKRNPLNTIFAAKRLIRHKFSDMEIQRDIQHYPFKVIKDPNSEFAKIQVTYKNQEKLLYPEEILAMILQKLRRTASNYLGKNVRDAVITVPSNFNDSQRQSIKDAGTIAGLNILRVINDTSAVSMAFGINKMEKQKQKDVVIFDWGGSHLSVSIVALEEDLYEIKSSNGISNLGGEDLDNKLVEYCIKEFRNKTSINIDIRENPKAFQRLKIACEKAKIDLSSSNQTTIDIDCLIGEEDFNIVITRDKFEELCKDLFIKCKLPLENVLKDAHMTKDQIDEIILVGGSSQIPKIKEMIQEFFNGKNLNTELNPKEPVVCGAAIQAAVMTNVKDESVERVILLDVTPFSLGVETIGGVMTVFIPRNSTIPCKKTQILSTDSDNQTSFLVQIFEGERQLTKDNICLGKFILNGIPPMPKGQPQIEITFDIDANSILAVTAQEKSTGINNKIVITNDKNTISKEDIDKMCLEFQIYEDEEKEKNEAKINFDMYFYGIRQMIKDLKEKNKFSENEKNLIKIKINEIYDWRNNNHSASKEEYDAKIKEIETSLNPIMQKICKQDENVLKGEKEI